MTGTRKSDRERLEALMMASLDGELAAKDHRALQEALENDPALGAEWQRLQTVKEATEMMQLRTPPDRIWGVYWESVYNRLERGTAWILVSLGATVLVGWGVWQAVETILADTTTPTIIKVAIAGTALGAAMLLISVLREKLFVRRQDPYREVER